MFFFIVKIRWLGGSSSSNFIHNLISHNRVTICYVHKDKFMVPSISSVLKKSYVLTSLHFMDLDFIVLNWVHDYTVLFTPLKRSELVFVSSTWNHLSTTLSRFFTGLNFVLLMSYESHCFDIFVWSSYIYSKTFLADIISSLYLASICLFAQRHFIRNWRLSSQHGEQVGWSNLAIKCRIYTVWEFWLKSNICGDSWSGKERASWELVSYRWRRRRND